MSADLVWNIVKKNSSFIVRRNGVEFTREKGNMTSFNCRQASGLAHRETVDIAPAANNRGVEMTTKKIARIGPVTRKLAKRPISVTHAHGPRRTARAIAGRLADYRADLRKPALARASIILKSQRKVKPALKRTRGKRAGKVAAKTSASGAKKSE